MAANPACVAYEAYRKYRNDSADTSAYMTPWDCLSEPEKKAWWQVVAAMAAYMRAQNVDLNNPRCPMERSNVFKLIDGERDYQDAKWGDHKARPKQVGSWLSLMRVHLQNAECEWAQSTDDEKALDCIRKVAAIAVACMEQHGAPPRMNGSHSA